MNCNSSRWFVWPSFSFSESSFCAVYTMPFIAKSYTAHLRFQSSPLTSLNCPSTRDFYYALCNVSKNVSESQDFFYSYWDESYKISRKFWRIVLHVSHCASRMQLSAQRRKINAIFVSNMLSRAGRRIQATFSFFFALPTCVVRIALNWAEKRSVHITPALISLHWLRVPERISFKLAVMTYRSIHGTSPSYLQSCLHCHMTRVLQSPFITTVWTPVVLAIISIIYVTG